jgi:hypothetical protein
LVGGDAVLVADDLAITVARYSEIKPKDAPSTQGTAATRSRWETARAVTSRLPPISEAAYRLAVAITTPTRFDDTDWAQPATLRPGTPPRWAS